MKAILKNGLILPQEPVPADWPDGTELDVEKAFTPLCADALDQWFADMEATAAQGDPEDDERLMQAIQEIRRQEKDLARRQAGLPE